MNCFLPLARKNAGICAPSLWSLHWPYPRHNTPLVVQKRSSGRLRHIARHGAYIGSAYGHLFPRMNLTGGYLVKNYERDETHWLLSRAGRAVAAEEELFRVQEAAAAGHSLGMRM